MDGPVPRATLGAMLSEAIDAYDAPGDWGAVECMTRPSNGYCYVSGA
jgi:hypothetical protein